MIAHRLSTILHADRIIVLEKDKWWKPERIRSSSKPKDFITPCGVNRSVNASVMKNDRMEPHVRRPSTHE